MNRSTPTFIQNTKFQLYLKEDNIILVTNHKTKDDPYGFKFELDETKRDVADVYEDMYSTKNRFKYLTDEETIEDDGHVSLNSSNKISKLVVKTQNDEIYVFKKAHIQTFDLEREEIVESIQQKAEEVKRSLASEIKYQIGVKENTICSKMDQGFVEIKNDIQNIEKDVMKKITNLDKSIKEEIKKLEEKNIERHEKLKNDIEKLEKTLFSKVDSCQIAIKELQQKNQLQIVKNEEFEKRLDILHTQILDLVADNNLKVITCGSFLSTYKQNNPNKLIIRKTQGTNGWNSGIMLNSCKKYKVKNLITFTDVMVGFAPNSPLEYNPNGSNYYTFGYYVYLSDGKLYSLHVNKQGVTLFNGLNFGINQEVICEYKNGDFSITNGSTTLVAYQNLPLGMNVVIDLHNVGVCVEFEILE